MSNLIPTTVVDKNGKTTTVHKKSEDASSTNARPLNGAPVASTHEVAAPRTTQANSHDTLVSSLSPGDVVSMSFGDDYTEDLEADYQEPEALVFEYIRDASVFGEATYLGERYAETTLPNGTRWKSNRYEITLHNGIGNYITVPFSSGLGNDKVPDINMVLNSLVSDAVTLDNHEMPGPDDDGFDPMLEINIRKQTETLRAFVGDRYDYARLLWGESAV